MWLFNSLIRYLAHHYDYRLCSL